MSSVSLCVCSETSQSRLPLDLAAAARESVISTARSVMMCENCLRSLVVRNIGEHNLRCLAL